MTKDTIYPGRSYKRDMTTGARQGRELIRSNPGADLVLSEIGELYEIVRDDPQNGLFDALGLAFDFGVYVGSQLAEREGE